MPASVQRSAPASTQASGPASTQAPASAQADGAASAHSTAPASPQATAPAAVEPLPTFAIVADAIPQRLTPAAGDPARGRAIVANRQVGLCLLCHSGPFPEERFQGNLAPDLAGAGARWSEGQLRLRIVDGRRLNPQTIMPSYFRTDGLVRVGPAWSGRPVFSAQQVEDVVAYLATLKN